MTIRNFTGTQAGIPEIAFGGGLNTTAGPLSLNSSEASDLQNIDFNRFGSFFKRNGYSTLNGTAIPNTPSGDGLHWFEYDSGGSLTRKAIAIADGKAWKMDDLDGTWDEISEDQSVVFTGTGLDDATSSGTYTGNGDIEYKVVIDSAGAPDTFEWFKDSVSQAAGVAITGGAQLLDNGLSITFAATTGHTVTDQWVFHPAVTITATNQVDFETFDNKVFMTNGVNLPFFWDGVGNVKLMTVPTGLTTAQLISQYNNYLFLGNVTVSGVKYRSRIYWSGLLNTTSWTATDFLEISFRDGQSLTGLRVLSSVLVAYKSRSIYNVSFTGDADIPFVLPGGGKSNSDVGCVSSFSIQDVANAHVFLSYDGIYLYDGGDSFKISDRINTTIIGYNENLFPKCVSMNQKTKHRYWLAFSTPSASPASQNDEVIIWDYSLNAFSLYRGMRPAAMATFYVGGLEERPYFSDYLGYTYRADNGDNDNPAGVETAISGIYKTNWRAFGDFVNQKGVAEVVIYYEQSNSTLNFGYSYDFEEATEYQQSFSISAGGTTWGAFTWGGANWASSGGDVIRRDLTGRGRVVRLIFENSAIDETFRVDGLGTGAFLETNV